MERVPASLEQARAHKVWASDRLSLACSLVHRAQRVTHSGRGGWQIWWLEFASLVLRYEFRLSDEKKTRYRSGMFQMKNRDPDKVI